jgi:hypothetical protein
MFWTFGPRYKIDFDSQLKQRQSLKQTRSHFVSKIMRVWLCSWFWWLNIHQSLA